MLDFISKNAIQELKGYNYAIPSTVITSDQRLFLVKLYWKPSGTWLRPWYLCIEVESLYPMKPLNVLA